MAEFVGAAEPLTRAGFTGVVDGLGVGVPELLAVLAVESKTCGFLRDRRPIILFERHIFHKRTGGIYSDANPDISNKVPGGYTGLAGEYPRLKKAAKLDRRAALESASWGGGQIMGFNHAAAGFAGVDLMVAAMQASEDLQLVAVAKFLESQNLTKHLRAKDWASFARAYNGKDFAKNKYDVRLAGAFQEYSSGALPDVEIRRAQMYLTYLGYAPGTIDGIHGKFSRSAVSLFRNKNGLGDSDRIDQALLGVMQAQVRAL